MPMECHAPNQPRYSMPQSKIIFIDALPNGSPPDSGSSDFNYLTYFKNPFNMRKITPLMTLLIFLSIICYGQDPPSVSGITDICHGSNTSLTASGEPGASFAWYDAETGGNLLASTAELTTGSLTTDIHFYVQQTTPGGTSSRTDVLVNVIPIPNPPSPTNVSANSTNICEGESAGLTASVDSANHQKVHWYDASTGGTLLGVFASGDTFTVSPTSTTTYYAQSQAEIIQNTFNYTGGAQTFTVPAGITQIDIDAYGARGGNSYNTTGVGLGGRVQTTMDVTPGQVLNIYVGGEGASYAGYGNLLAGGWNGGGNGTNTGQGGGGGGATDIRIGGTALSNRVLVAGGAGGKAPNTCNAGSTAHPHGGGLTGARGFYCTNGSGELKRGRGGSQSAGGAGGCWHGGSNCAGSGGYGYGGNGGSISGNGRAGGGGGGWYGGGGGTYNSDGGGGSSYTNPSSTSNVTHTQGVRNGHGLLTISYSLLPQDCASTTREAITIDVTPLPTVIASSDTYNCSGSGVGISASGADTYTWEPGNLSGASISVDPSLTTTYIVTGTTSGCSDTAEVLVTVSDVVASSDVSICIGASTTLSASGANTYTWEPGSLSGASISVQPSTTTIYTVYGTDPSNCITTDEVTVTVNPVPNISASNDTTVLSGTPAMLSASGADSYTWSPVGLSGQSVSVSPSVNTIYTVTGTISATSCTSTEDITVDVIPLAPNVSGNLSLCSGYETQLIAAGVSGASLTWYDAATGGNILSSIDTLNTGSLSNTTSFYVEQTIAGNTSSRTEVIVKVIPSPSPLSPINVSANSTSICEGESAGLTATVDSASFQKVHWYDASTGGNLLGVFASGDTFTVSPTSMTTYYAQSQLETFQSTFAYTGGVQTFTVPPGITEINIDAYGARGGNTQYTSGGYALGGRVQARMQVSPGQILNIYVGGAGGNYPGTWNPPGGYNGGGNGNKAGAAGGGATDIRINGTTTADRILVAGGGGGRGWGLCSSNSVNAVPHGGGLTGGSGKYCTSGSGELQRGHGGSQTAGGRPGCWHGGSPCTSAGGFGYGGNGGAISGGGQSGGGGGGWYGGGGGVERADGGGGSSYTDPSLFPEVTHTQGVHNGHGQLIISYSSLPQDCALPIREAITIDVTPLPTVVVSNDTFNCPGNGVTLTASGADSYLWEPGALTGASVVVDPSVTTTYTVTGTTGNCSDTDQVLVTVLEVVASADVSICQGTTTTLSATGGNTYTWEPGNLSGNSIDVTPTMETTYIVSSQDPSGCISSDSVIVTVNDIPVLVASNDTTIDNGASLSLMVSGADTYSWSPGSIAGDSVVVSPSTTTTYTVTGTYTATACTSTEDVVVNVVEIPEIRGTMTVLMNESTQLIASGPVGSSFAWYDAETGGNLLASSDTLTTAALMQNTVVYVSLIDGGNSSSRVPVNLTAIDSTLVAVGAAEDTICPGSSTDLGAALLSPGVIHWYDSITGGTLLGTSESGVGHYVSPSSSQSYYAEGVTQEKTEIFSYTGAVQSFTVPYGVTSIEIDAYGARGGNTYNTTGLGQGGRVQATMNVTPGQVLNLYVGGQGASYAGFGSMLAGGWNGGGNGTITGQGGGGGGASDIRIDGTSLADRVLVAGGGGGKSPGTCTAGSTALPHGGGLTGASGFYCSGGPGEAKRGRGGSQTAGGRPGCWYNGSSCAGSGGFGYGGNGGSVSGHGRAGGGGGGWYGGGGGTYNSDGGGGSSYTKKRLFQNVVHSQGVRNGHGQISITYSKNSSTNTRSTATISVGDFEEPVPDVTNLPDVEDDPPLSVSAPDATDACAGTITATTTDPTTYNSDGTYVIQWNYDDGNGNISSQNQTIIVGSGLPVELSDFSAHCEGKHVELVWRTESEINSSHFEIQHSRDGIRWETFGTVNSIGDSEVSKDYQFTAESRFGFELYRLKQVDYDGSTDYSKIINAACAVDDGQIKIYPNPTVGNFTVSYEGTLEEELTLILIDNIGQELEKRKLELSNGFGKTNFDLTGYPAGFYKLQVSSLGHLKSYRIIKIQD